MYAGQVMNDKAKILKNGGALENEVADDAGLGKSGIIERYWIMLE